MTSHTHTILSKTFLVKDVRELGYKSKTLFTALLKEGEFDEICEKYDDPLDEIMCDLKEDLKSYNKKNKQNMNLKEMTIRRNKNKADSLLLDLKIKEEEELIKERIKKIEEEEKEKLVKEKKKELKVERSIVPIVEKVAVPIVERVAVPIVERVAVPIVERVVKQETKKITMSESKDDIIKRLKKQVTDLTRENKMLKFKMRKCNVCNI